MQILFWVLALFSLAVLLASRFILGFWNDYMWIPLCLFLLFSVVAIIKSKNSFRDLLLARTTKTGFNFITSLLIAVVVLFIVNFVIHKNNWLWDISTDKRHSIGQNTLNILSKLENNYEIKVFYTREDTARKEATFNLLKKFSDASSKIKVTFYDPNLYPDLVESYNLRSSGTLILEGNNKTSRLVDSTNPDTANYQAGIREEQLVLSLRGLDKSERSRLCYVDGHGEKNLNDQSPLGASDFRKSLEDLSYDLAFVELNENLLSENCSIILLIGPELSFNEAEFSILYDLTKTSAKLFLAIDPGKRHNLGRFTRFLGLRFSNKYVFDVEGQVAGSNAALSVGRNYNQEHPITSYFDDSMYSFFPVASYFTLAQAKGFQQTPLIYSSQQSFSKNDLNDIKNLNASEQHETGPFLLAAAVSSTTTGFKAVVFSDSDFLLNQFYLKIINADISLNTISYLEGDLELISDNRIEKPKDILILTDFQKNLFIVLFISIPLLCFLLASILYYRGRD